MDNAENTTIDPRLRKELLKELFRQAEYARGLIDILLGELPAEEVWRITQSMLGALAICSKILQPPRSGPGGVYQTRGEILRSMLNVADDSPILDRAIRDAFEHIDERFHRWAAESAAEAPLDLAVIRGVEVAINFEDPSEKNIFRFYYNGELRFWDLVLDIHDVRAALDELLSSPGLRNTPISPVETLDSTM